MAGSAAASADEIQAESVVLQLIDQAELAAGEAGLLVELKVAEGESVERGKVVARIDDTDARIAQQAAEIELALATTEAENDVAIRYAEKAQEAARAELARSEESIANFPRSVSQSQLDVERLTVAKLTLDIEQARHQLHLAKLRKRVAESKLNAAELQLRRRRIIAPFDGVAVAVERGVGEWVEPGQTLVRIVSAQKLKAEGFVSATDAADGLEGANAIITRRLGSEPLAGKVAFVSPEIDPITKQVRLWAEIDNSDGKLRPGEQVDMVIGIDRGAE